MRYNPIDKSLFIENRKKFMARMKPKSIAIFHSNDIMPTNADGVMPFKQNSDLFYLSGIDQEETSLILFPDAIHERFREILFIKETSELIAIWEGHKFTKSEAANYSGIDTIFWSNDFKENLRNLISEIYTGNQFQINHFSIFFLMILIRN